MLRIGIDAANVQPAPRGRGFRRLLFLLLGALAENAEQNQYMIFSPYRAMRDYLPPDPRFRLAHPRRYIPMLHRKGVGLVGRFLLQGFDLVHFPCVDIWYTPRGKSVVNIHDLASLRFPERFFKAAREEALHRFNLSKIVEYATRIVTGSDFSRQDIITKLGVEPSRIRTVHPSNDPVFLKGAQPLLRGEGIRLGIEEPYFLFVGGIDFRKNIPLLLSSYSLYRRLGGRANLVMVGEQNQEHLRRYPASYSPPLQELLSSMKERDHIRWLRDIPDETLPAIYAGARALVNVSMFEGFGSPLIEAMACGTPVIAARSSCFPEITGGAALLVEPREEEVSRAMSDIDKDETLREKLKALGRERAKFFSPAKYAREMLSVYQDVAQDK